MTYKFTKRSNKLYIDIKVGGKRLRRSLGVDLHDLEVERNTVFGASKAAILAQQTILDLKQIIADNLTYDDLAVAIDKYMNPDTPKEEEPLYLHEYIDEYINAMKRGKIRTGGKTYSQTTIWNYEAMADHYKEYVGKDDIDLIKSDISDQTDKIRHIRKMKAHFQGYINYLKEEKGQKTSSIHVTFSKLKAILNYFEDETGIRVHIGKVSVPKGQAKVFHWPEYFTKRVLSGSIDNKMDAAMLTAIKIHILSTARVSDFLAFKEDNFIQRPHGDIMLNLVVYTNSKNNKLSSAPIPEKLYYEALSNLQQYGSILPHPNPNREWYQRHLLKVLSNYFGADKVMAEYVNEGEDGKVITGNRPVSSETTTHTLRKAGISLYRNLDRVTLGKMSGHSADSKLPDSVYIGVSDAQFSEVQKLQEVLINSEIQ